MKTIDVEVVGYYSRQESLRILKTNPRRLSKLIGYANYYGVAYFPKRCNRFSKDDIERLRELDRRLKKGLRGNKICTQYNSTENMDKFM